MAAISNWRNEIEIEITVEREELLKRLKANREKHADEFALAIKAWQDDLSETTRGINSEDHFSFPDVLEELQNNCPESHLDIYDKAIDMFSMSVNDTIKLDSETFNKLCRDEWDWKQDTRRNKYYIRIGIRN